MSVSSDVTVIVVHPHSVLAQANDQTRSPEVQKITKSFHFALRAASTEIVRLNDMNINEIVFSRFTLMFSIPISTLIISLVALPLIFPAIPFAVLLTGLCLTPIGAPAFLATLVCLYFSFEKINFDWGLESTRELLDKLVQHKDAKGTELQRLWDKILKDNAGKSPEISIPLFSVHQFRDIASMTNCSDDMKRLLNIIQHYADINSGRIQVVDG